MYRNVWIALIAALAVTVTASTANAGGKKSKVAPKVFGKTIAQWSAEWWKWAYGTPASVHPITDETGAFCDVGQPNGKVWFLAGTFGDTGVVRTCTIPKGKALFLPLVNAAWIDCPDSGDADIPDDVVRWIMSTFAAGDTACQLTCFVDGVSVSNLLYPITRTQSPIFSVTLPEDNPWGACGDPSPAGLYERVISEGYWVMLPPLSPGEHTIELHGATCSAPDPDNAPNELVVDFEVGVTYHLTVAGHDEGDDDDDDDDD